MSRVLFANPFRLAASALEQEWQTPYPPLGLLYVAASARRAGHEVAFYDATFETDHAAFDAHFETFQPVPQFPWRRASLPPAQSAETGQT